MEASQQPEPPPPPSPERVAILTPSGPLLIDVRFTVDGKPHTSAFETSVNGVLEAADSDGDGRATWKELVANRAYFEKQMPNAPAPDSARMKTLIEQYDENRDGTIQHSEAAAWLGRDAGTSARPFSVRSTRAYRPVARATSQVWHLVDVNDDGRLTNDEITAAPARLLSLDADDDRILAPAEMASLREQLQAAGRQPSPASRQANHYAAIHLDPATEIGRLNYLLSDLYAPRQNLGPSSFRELTPWYTQHDENGDGLFDTVELASMLDAEPHVEMEIAFDAPGDTPPAAATIDVKTLVPEVSIAVRPSASRAILSLGNTRLILSAHNLATKITSDMPAAQVAARNQIRLMVHDQADALFEELDANADGRLGEREIAYCPQRLAAADRNADGQLAGDEFPYSMIVAFLRAEQPSQQSFYIPPSPAVEATSTDNPLPSWFAPADLNGDGDVSRREFLGAPQHFHRLDTNSDGYISLPEATNI